MSEVKPNDHREQDLQSNQAPLKDPGTGLTDWSTVHINSGSLIQTPAKPSEWKKFKLSEQQVEQFFRDGYLAPVKILSEDDCNLLLKDYESFLEGEEHPFFYEFHRNQTGDKNNVLMHALGHWRITQRFHDLIFHPAISVPGSQLLSDTKEEKVRFWHDQLFAKPPKYGGCVAWHQDYSYWTRTYPMKHLTIHVALDDQSTANGCIHYIPGSHTWTRDGKPLPVTDFNFKDMESIKTILKEDELASFKPTPCTLKKGEASFHHPLVVHGSYPNRSEKPRRATVVNYFADGVKSSTNESLLKGTDPIPKNECISGQFFPFIYDPKWAQI